MIISNLLQVALNFQNPSPTISILHLLHFQTQLQAEHVLQVAYDLPL